MKITQFLILMTITSSLFSQTPKMTPGYLDSTQLYEFYSHYWFNLHHFAQQEALLNTARDSSIIPEETWQKLSRPDKEAIEKLITYYKDNLVDKDLRTNNYMYDFKHWILNQAQEINLDIPTDYKEHVKVLQAANQVYKKYFWPLHSKTNQKVLSDNLDFIRESEVELTTELARLTASEWQEEKVRVDICYFGKSSSYNIKNRPYTNLSPTHIVMNASFEADKPSGNWLEMLFHESSHNLIGSRTGFIAGTINNISAVTGQKAPRSLWHAYLFYFSGWVARDFLHSKGIEKYELYMVRQRVFSRHFPALDKHLPDYIEGKRTLHDVTLDIFSDLRN